LIRDVDLEFLRALIGQERGSHSEWDVETLRQKLSCRKRALINAHGSTARHQC
jgi:hypothetical protein